MSNAVATALYSTLKNDITNPLINVMTVAGITLLEAAISDPTAMEPNSAYFNSDENLFRLWDGSNWDETDVNVVVDGGGGGSSIVPIGGIGSGTPAPIEVKTSAEVVSYFEANEFVSSNYYVFYDSVTNEVWRVTASLKTFGVIVYAGVAKREANYPFITITPVSDVPRIYHRGDTSTSQTTWDLKIWDKSMLGVGDIYDRVIEILETDIEDIPDGLSASFRGRGMPLMAEDNRPNEILYSRVIECEVIF